MTNASADKWSLYTYAPSLKLPSAAAMDKLAAEMSDKTNGEVEFQMNLGGSLQLKCPTSDKLSLMVSFNLLVTLISRLYLRCTQRMPMLMVTDEEYDLAMEKVMIPHMTKKYAEAGITLLGSYTYPLTVTYSNVPAVRLSDLSGKKIRVLSQTSGEFVKAFGGVPVNMSTPEVSTALQQGVVDAIHAATAGGGQLWGP